MKDGYFEEYGSVGGINFLQSGDVKYYDENDNEIEIPYCEKCNVAKGIVHTKNESYFYCLQCDLNKYDKERILQEKS